MVFSVERSVLFAMGSFSRLPPRLAALVAPYEIREYPDIREDELVTNQAPVSAAPAIRVEHLTVVRGRTRAVDDVSFELEAGTLVGRARNLTARAGSQRASRTVGAIQARRGMPRIRNKASTRTTAYVAIGLSPQNQQPRP